MSAAVRRLPLRHALVLGLLTGVFALAFVVHLHRASSAELGWFPVYVDSHGDADGLPQVRGFWPGVDRPPGLELGDRLVSLRGRSLRGVGPLALLAWVYAGSSDQPGVAFEVERDGARSSVLVALVPIAFQWKTIPIALGFGLSGLIIGLRARGSPAARLFSAAALCYGIHWSICFGGPLWLSAAGIAIFLVSGALFPPLAVAAALWVPENVAPRSGVGRLWPWVFLSHGVWLSSWLVGWPLPGAAGFALVQLSNAAFLVAILAVLTRNYRRADGGGRRQLRWVLYGFYIGVTPAIVAALATQLQPRWEPLYQLAVAFTALVPICIGIAIVRSNFLDIDRLISATAAYTVLSIAFLGALVSLVPTAAQALSSVLDTGSDRVQIGLAMLMAGVLVPTERFIRPPIERLFFRERFALESGVRALRSELADAKDTPELLHMVAERLRSLLRLRLCAVYVRSGEVFAPIFAHGPLVPSSFAGDGAFVTLLEDQRSATTPAQWRRWLGRGRLSEIETASLQSLAPELLLGVRREDVLACFFALGEKGSGDIYTPTDVALLEGLTEQIELALLRFDTAQTLADEREMTATLRSYVPGSVAEELARGARLEDGEVEATILFVDIRGYTSFSQSRDPDEIFRLVNRYTRAASRLLREHGGTVVEFHGDGLLAVFGAPAPLANKERAAIEAGLAIIDEVPRLSLGEDEEGPPGGLAAGVGIATGSTYVGNIQAVDRKIWTTIGNTTNLAARLQDRCKALEASMVIDQTTFERAGDLPGFEANRDFEIRGRDDRMTIYALPRVDEAS